MRTTLAETLDQDQISRLRIAVLRLTRRMRQQVHSGITPSQHSALATIEHNGPLSLGELAALENVRPPSISRLVALLEADGYVERIADPSDRRLSLVQVTPKASQELEQIRAERNRWLAECLAELPEADRQRMAAALPVLERLVEMDDLL